MLHPTAGPDLAQDIDHFIGAASAPFESLAQEFEFLAHPAHPDAEFYAIPRHHRGGPHRLGHQERIPHGQHEDTGKKANAFGDRGHGPYRHPGVGPIRKGRPARQTVFGVGIGGLELPGLNHVIRQGDSGETRRLGGARHGTQVGRVAEGPRNAKFHSGSLTLVPTDSHDSGMRRPSIGIVPKGNLLPIFSRAHRDDRNKTRFRGSHRG